MSTLLYVQSSLYGAQGASSQLAERFVAQWLSSNPDGRVIRRDLAADPVPHLTAERFQAFNTAPEARTPDQQAVVAYSDALIDELRSADAIVLGVPMYNFSVPSTLRTYFDHIARAGVTFRYTSAGPEGLLAGRRAYVFVTRGGVYGAAADTQVAVSAPVPGLHRYRIGVRVRRRARSRRGITAQEPGGGACSDRRPHRDCTGSVASIVRRIDDVLACIIDSTVAAMRTAGASTSILFCASASAAHGAVAAEAARSLDELPAGAGRDALVRSCLGCHGARRRARARQDPIGVGRGDGTHDRSRRRDRRGRSRILLDYLADVAAAH